MTSRAASSRERICVIGLGYIGLPTAAVLAQSGKNVIGVDVSASRVEAVNRAEVPFTEDGLAEALAQVVASGKLHAQCNVPSADVYIVTVPTPFIGEDHRADLSYIEAAAVSIAPQLRGGELIILESTSPPGTTQHLAQMILDARPDFSSDPSDSHPVIHCAYCPERVLPGRIMSEIVSNARIIGGLTEGAAERAREVYESFSQGEVILTDAKTAEMVKLAENSFRDVNIAFANELSILCEKLGVDVWELIALANRHPRVNILNPGPGVGGHCVAVDPWFLVSALPNDARLIRTAREVNDAKPAYVVDAVVAALRGVEAPRIAALGLAFKANVDDLRESPALRIIEALAQVLPSSRICAVEPHITDLPDALAKHSNIELTDFEAALEGADIIVLLVDHDVFTAYPWHKVCAPVIDTRGVICAH